MGPQRRPRRGRVKRTRADSSRFAALLRARSERSNSLIYEVFRQERKGQPFQHAGSLEAASLEYAELYARDFYGRRNESNALWVVPREAITELGAFVDELGRNYHRVDGYSLKEKLKEARARVSAKSADTLSAGGG